MIIGQLLSDYCPFCVPFRLIGSDVGFDFPATYSETRFEQMATGH
jgi:hypothetical protein